MIVRFFDYLRTKPSATRKRYAVGMASTITGVIALVWVSVLPARFMDDEAATASLPTAPFASLWGEFREQMGGARDAVAQLGSITPATSSEPLGTTTFDALTLVSATTTVGDLQPAPLPVLIATTSSETVREATTSATSARPLP
jgi:hypothetical protein